MGWITNSSFKFFQSLWLGRVDLYHYQTPKYVKSGLLAGHSGGPCRSIHLPGMWTFSHSRTIAKCEGAPFCMKIKVLLPSTDKWPAFIDIHGIVKDRNRELLFNHSVCAYFQEVWRRIRTLGVQMWSSCWFECKKKAWEGEIIDVTEDDTEPHAMSLRVFWDTIAFN